MHPHHSATAVVVKVHQCSGVFYHSLPGIHKGFGKLDTIIHVVATATPVKVSHFIMRSSSLVGVTTAAPELPLAACSSDCIHHSSRGDCIYKCCLTATCQDQNKMISLSAVNPIKKNIQYYFKTLQGISIDTVPFIETGVMDHHINIILSGFSS